jgi:hypothetical protein
MDTNRERKFARASSCRAGIVNREWTRIAWRWGVSGGSHYGSCDGVSPELHLKMLLRLIQF